MHKDSTLHKKNVNYYFNEEFNQFHIVLKKTAGNDLSSWWDFPPEKKFGEISIKQAVGCNDMRT